MKKCTILLIMELSDEANKSIIRGMMETNNNDFQWDFHIMDPKLPYNSANRIISTAKKINAMAIIGKLPKNATSKALELNIPIVLKSRTPSDSPFSNITADNQSVGEKAARFYIEQGYRNFAYFGISDAEWSITREAGFHHAIEKYCSSYHPLLIKDTKSYQDTVLSWLKTLPSQTAILACNDSFGQKLCNLCLENDISIPNDVAILGVDNEEFTCTISHPTLSSVSINTHLQGKILGENLQAMINEGSFKKISILAQIGHVVERESTLHSNNKNKLIYDLIHYIDKEFASIDKASDVIQKYPLSERSIEIKFKAETGGKTVYKYILEKKIGRMKDLLRTTDLPISEIAVMSGFTDIYKVSRIFKRETSMSPKEYRKKYSPFL